eukprot:scaffold34450_cov19-Tisochrysis_lutea.AAC.1
MAHPLNEHNPPHHAQWACTAHQLMCHMHSAVHCSSPANAPCTAPWPSTLQYTRSLVVVGMARIIYPAGSTATAAVAAVLYAATSLAQKPHFMLQRGRAKKSIVLYVAMVPCTKMNRAFWGCNGTLHSRHFCHLKY